MPTQVASSPLDSSTAPSISNTSTSRRTKAAASAHRPVTRSMIVIEPCENYLDLNREPIQNMAYERQIYWAHSLGMVRTSTTQPKTSYLLAQMRKVSARPLDWSCRTIEHLKKICPPNMLNVVKPKKDDYVRALNSLTTEQQWTLSGIVEISVTQKNKDKSEKTTTIPLRRSQRINDKGGVGISVMEKRTTKDQTPSTANDRAQEPKAQKTPRLRFIIKVPAVDVTHGIGNVEKAKSQGSKSDSSTDQNANHMARATPTPSKQSKSSTSSNSFTKNSSGNTKNAAAPSKQRKTTWPAVNTIVIDSDVESDYDESSAEDDY